VSASSPDSPRSAPRFGFQWGNYRYEVHGDVGAHPDYDAGLLASRQLILPGYPEVVGQSRLVELKPFFPHQHPSGAVDRCIEEVRRAGLVRHPNLAGIWGCVFDDTKPYVLMEHLPGCFLLTLLDAAVAVGRRLSPSFVAYLATELGDGLHHVHRKKDEEERPLNLVHRAIGPRRIRVGVAGRIQLTHFGVVYTELLDRPPSPGGLLRGDAAYLAPELLTGFLQPEDGQEDPLTPKGLNERADVFSLGLVMLEMLLVRYPRAEREPLWQDLKARFPASVLNEEPSLVKLETLANRVLHFGPAEVRRAADEMPEPLRRIITRALRSNPDERYATSSDMHGDLYDYLHSMKPLYGPKEAAEEATEILMEAADLGRLGSAARVEPGLPSPPPDAEPGNLH
jgi:eukaryotic-like serine/threonine-protein kinase